MLYWIPWYIKMSLLNILLNSGHLTSRGAEEGWQQMLIDEGVLMQVAIILFPFIATDHVWGGGGGVHLDCLHIFCNVLYTGSKKCSLKDKCSMPHLTIISMPFCIWYQQLALLYVLFSQMTLHLRLRYQKFAKDWWWLTILLIELILCRKFCFEFGSRKMMETGGKKLRIWYRGGYGL